MKEFTRIPKHIGVIPDGNRRWAIENQLEKYQGYDCGIKPGFELFEECKKLGIQELTLYGFTQDNTKRPAEQKVAFKKACVDAVVELENREANLLVVGDSDSHNFPDELLKYTKRNIKNTEGVKVNFLVNYDWKWDIAGLLENSKTKEHEIHQNIKSKDVSRIDLVIRWGDRRRLSGFLPIQTVYSDFYILPKMWPDFKVADLHEALEWYNKQDVTLGG
ncbi:MAG TPA: dihydroorotate dehydrogenase [Clostridiales bacterium]|nr:MAG: dihydroorotate dehydrogenase [Clostridiales bacterium GWD2_32_19]HCC07956.1 dihydroorotate dehydrogenase [Clostridiales bacterium]